MYLLEMRLRHAQETLETLEGEGINNYITANIRAEIERIEDIIASEKELQDLIDSEVIYA